MSNDPANPPDKLPEDLWKYFNRLPGTIEVPLSKLVPIRARPDGIAKGKKYMWQAFLGVNKKRDPITLKDIGGGKYEVADGNSTYANAVSSGWGSIAGIVEDAEKTTDKEAAGLKYVGIFFTTSQMAEILRWWKSEVGIPFLAKRSHNPHVTTAFNPPQSFLDSQPLGKRVQLKITMWAADELGQAVAVSGYPSRADYPHLTISHDSSVKAYCSNVLLSDLDSRHTVSGPTIEGVLGYFDGERLITETPSLRSDMIRLAHANPKLRPHLLPLLKSAADNTLEFSLTVSGVIGIGMMQKALGSLDGKRVEGMTLSVKSVKTGGGEATVKFSVSSPKEFTDKLTEAVTAGAEKLLLGIVKDASPNNVELEIL